jgi:hypothetical protein
MRCGIGGRGWDGVVALEAGDGDGDGGVSVSGGGVHTCLSPNAISVIESRV